jgi:flagellar motility protein MotE (MotC chaperone)
LKQVEGVLQIVQQIGRSIQNGTANISKELTVACSDLAEFVETLHAPEHVGDSSKKGSDGPVVQERLITIGSEGEDNILSEDYASVLQSYKDTEQQLSEIEKNNHKYHTEAMSELNELRSANTTKDEEIHSLRRMLSSLQRKMNAPVPDGVEKSEETSKISTTPTTEDKEIAEIDEYIKQCQVEEPPAYSVGEEKFRAEIDKVLEQNMDFWLRFSTSYHQIRNFQTAFDRLKAEMVKLTDAQAQGVADGIPTNHQVAKLESAVLEKKFRDLNTDLQVWMEKNVLLKGEVENRFSSLCSIQEDISKITILDKSDDDHFTLFQAAKFQGEVLNMKQENNKVAKELEAGLDHVRGLQVEVGRVLLKLRENLELSIARSNRAQQNFRALSTKAGVPLRTFLFGAKPKKPSLFSCMGPGTHKHYGRR